MFTITLHAGTYYSKKIQTSYKIIVRANQLTVLKNAGVEFKLEPHFADTYTNAESLGEIRFKREKGSHLTGFLLSTERVKALYFKKL